MTRINLFDFEAEARQHMNAGLYDFVSGGAMDEQTLRGNQAAYAQLKLQHRVLCGIKQADLTTQLLGHSLSMPIITAPTGSQALTHPDGELAVRKATAEAGTLMTVATTATHSMESIKKAGRGPLWFQLYLFKDEGLNAEVVERAERCGYNGIALTVDSPVFGKRERDIRNVYSLPTGLVYENLPHAGDSEGRTVSAFMNANWKQDLGWDDVNWLRKKTKMPILLKGVVHPQDAACAADHGVDGIWVSNHGGRQLDSAVATIEALPAIAKKVAGKLPVILDGGIRRGTDVIKALALGATAVAIGRPMLWGLAIAGQQGVAEVLNILRTELENVMALCGCATIDEITPDLIFNHGGIDV